MPKQFEVGFEGELPARPGEVWEAFTLYTKGWYWNIEYEPWLGGKESGLTTAGGIVTAWEPPTHFGTRCEEDNGWWNNLDYRLEDRGDTTYLRFVHTGLFEPHDYDVRYDACRGHTAFYYHSLEQYLRYFKGRDATYLRIEGSAATSEKGSFTRLCRALGLPLGAVQGDQVRLHPAGLDLVLDGVLDYLTPAFVGVRTEDGLYRFYGRDAWGQALGMGHHLFADGVDGPHAERMWQGWLHRLFDEPLMAGAGHDGDQGATR
ncbi:SRPBCC domain-containing protein [Nocardia sp. NBC_01499]|uniref:SRPBCC domain-containing protein n=1 Tax=Nocardia sp. NBC_01499 TaxID=2903597 RepID=UPI00386B958D